MTNKSKLYIEPIDKESTDEKEVYFPSSINDSFPEINDEQIANLNNTINSFVSGIANGLVGKWGVEKIELSISFSAKASAWIINLGGEGTIKLTLKSQN